MARFNQKVGIQTQNLASGSDSGLMALSGKFQQIAQKNLASREQSIIEDQTLTGQQSFVKGEQPKFMDEDRIVGGVSAKAYNKGLMAAYSASISNDMRQDLANIELNNPDDVAEYNAQVEANRNALAKSVDPAALPSVLARFDEHTTSGSIRVRQRGETKARANTKQILGDNIKSLGDESARLARLGDTDAARNGLIELSSHLDAAVAAETITAVDAKIELAKYQQDAMEQESRHQFDEVLKTDTGVVDALDKLSKIEDKPPKGWTPDKWDSYISSQRSDIIREKSRRDANKAEGSKLAFNAVKDYAKAATLGFEVSPEETARVGALASTDPALKKQFDIINNTKLFALTSRADRNEMISATQTGGLLDVDEYASIVSANKAINDAAAKDGYALGVSQGLITPVPMDISNPNSFAEKVKQAETLSIHYGVTVSPLSDSEATALSDGLNDMTTDEKVALANTLNASPSVWGQISDKNQGAFSMAGATGDQPVMTSVFKGQELLQAKLAIPVKQADYQMNFDEQVEGVYGVQDRRDLLAATIAHYAATHPDGEYDKSEFADSIEAVTGGIGEVNGFKVELPRGVDSETFEDFIDDIQPETIEALGGVQGVSNERAVELIQQSRVRNIKSGSYIIDYDGTQLWGNDNKPFVIEWSEELLSRNDGYQQSILRNKRSGQGGK